MHHDPIRLLLPGLTQIIYELYQNKGIANKLKGLFGSVNYKPEITREFHISAIETAQPAFQQEVSS